MKVHFIAALLVLSATVLLGAGKPIRSLIFGCEGNTYWDDVDKACVQGGTVEIMDGRNQWEILDVMWRRGDELRKIRGVTHVSVDRHGIRVDVDPDHDPIPATIEGARIHVMPDPHDLLTGATLLPPR